MSFKTKVWGFILTLLAVDSFLVWLFLLHSEDDNWTVWVVLAFGLIQICAGCIALVALYRHYRGNKWEIGKTKARIAIFTLMGTLYFLNVLRYVEMIASTHAGWHWYDFLGICWGLILSSFMLYVAYLALEKWKRKP